MKLGKYRRRLLLWIIEVCDRRLSRPERSRTVEKYVCWWVAHNGYPPKLATAFLNNESTSDIMWPKIKAEQSNRKVIEIPTSEDDVAMMAAIEAETNASLVAKFAIKHHA